MSKAKDIINELLVDVFNHILNIEGQILKKRGVKISMNEVHVLEATNTVKIPTMGNIAKKLRVTLGTLSTAVKALVRKGYLERKYDENDRRKIYLSLTKPAKEVLIIHEEFHNEMIESILSDLNIENDTNLINSLDNIRKFFKEKY